MEPQITVQPKISAFKYVLFVFLGIFLGVVGISAYVYYLKPQLITKEVEVPKVVEVEKEVMPVVEQRDASWEHTNVNKYLMKYPFLNSNGNQMEIVFYADPSKKDRYLVSLNDVKQSLTKELLNTDKSLDSYNFIKPISIYAQFSADNKYFVIYNDAPAEGQPLMYIFDENGEDISKGNIGTKLYNYAYKHAPKQLGMTGSHLIGWTDSTHYLYRISDGTNTYDYLLEVPSLVITLVK